MGLASFLSETLGLTKIPPHLPTILWSFAGFTFVHLVLAPWICARWFPVAYGTTKSKATKNNWAIHVVSQVHSVIIVAGAIYCIWTETPDREQDRAFGWSDTTGFVHGIAVGYFVWDSLDAIINYVDFGFVVHGIACSLVYGMSYKPFVAYYGTRCLLWEISTLFLNIHWFLDKTGNTGTTFQLVNGVFLLSSFFGVRLLYGGSVSVRFFFTLCEVWRDIPIFYIIIYGAGNFVLQGLNIFWFTKMIAALRKRFEPKNNEHTGLLGSNGNENGAATTPNGVH
ncbi:DUF887-domain-containing protein [Macrolepiota fuliginosa MF-IS2]|uniref:DUF887-domain-containing protein n=1 Tax=Macrolepiota fuliginosa MF-IS2 TaxID=1400762 RepID=A0A9P5XE75_9AGAR|nr:DUF887-domain-containing protein [Macrolepiota fuliginosa MF-IS2]